MHPSRVKWKMDNGRGRWTLCPAWGVICLLAAVLGQQNSELAVMETMDTPELIRHFGYVSESHVVVTEDGYLLTVHRIPGRTAGPTSAPPIFIQHGLMGASDHWVFMGPGKDLAFLLSDGGHDIWLGNARGNCYSRGHVNLTDKDSAYWDFSWHEMGYYDLPAVIDYVLHTTGHSQLFYIGHSMGTTMFYVLCAKRPEYNAKVKAMFSFAPVAFMTHAQYILRFLSLHSKQLERVLRRQRVYELFSRGRAINRFNADLCRDNSFFQPLCINFIFTISGYDYTQFNGTLIPILARHTAGTSIRSLMHYAQLIVSNEFREYDFGMKENKRRYNAMQPPSYNLSKITAPVCLHYSTNDFLAPARDVKLLAARLPNVIGMHQVPYQKFNHIDYLWGRDAKGLLYDEMMRLMDNMV